MVFRGQFEGALLGYGVGNALGTPLQGMARKDIKTHHHLVMNFLPGRHSYHFSTHQGGLSTSSSCAAMRAIQIGLLLYRDLARLKRAAIQESMMMHSDPRAVAGAVAVAFAVAYALRNFTTFVPDNFLSRTAEFVSDISVELADKVAGITYYLDRDYDEGLSYTGSSGSVMETVPAALLAFTKSPFEFESVVVEAVNSGGATDRIGAIAGAMAGALSGSATIPNRWLAHLENAEDLAKLGRELQCLANRQ